jgi:trehalose synthase-fused probable maltokinase
MESNALIEQVTRQRWYGAKSRAVGHADVLDSIVVRSVEPELTIDLVGVTYDTGAHDVYQLFSGAETEVARELVSAMRSTRMLQGEQGVVEFRPAADFTGLGQDIAPAKLVSSEQSNSSVVFGEELILKVFRRLEPGINPELEVLHFLAKHGFRNVPALAGWYEYIGRPLTATLGLLQEFVADGVNGWELALDEMTEAPERFLDRLPRLGEVTAQLHNTLGSDLSDPAFAPEEPSVEALALLTATVDEEIARVFLSLPEDNEQLAPILGRGEEVREQLRFLTHAGSTGRVIRTHGDFHLGQTLVTGDDWVLLDFEGEPARTLVERRHKRSALRDVAGMLRSFTYAATTAELVGGATVPEDWEERARWRFLDSYLAAVDPTLLPAGDAAIERPPRGVRAGERRCTSCATTLDNRPDWGRRTGPLGIEAILAHGGGDLTCYGGDMTVAPRTQIRGLK